MAEKLYGLGAIIRLVDNVTGPASKVARAFDSVLGKAKALDAAGRMQQFGNRMLFQATLLNQAASTMKGGFDKVISSFGGIEDAATFFETVATPVGGSIANAYQLAIDRALEFSRQHTTTAADYLRSAYQMGSASLATEAALAGTDAAMKVAIATKGEATETTKLLAMMYNNLGDTSADVQGEMNRLGDIITATQQKFMFPTLGPLIEGMKYAGSAAKTYRVSLGQLMPVMGSLNNLGYAGTLAGTMFQATLIKITAASKKLGIGLRYTKEGNLDLIGFLEDLRKKYGLLSEASGETKIKVTSAFGELGARTIMALAGSEGALREYSRAMENSTGITEKTVATMERTLSAHVKILGNNLVALYFTVGKFIGPSLKLIYGAVKGVVGQIADFAAQHPLIAKIAGAFLGFMAVITAVVVPVMYLVGSLALLGGAALPVLAAIGGFILAAAPFVAAAMAIAAVVYLIYRNWDWLWGQLKLVCSGIGDVVKSIVGPIKTHIDTIANILLGLSGPVGWVVLAFRHWDVIGPIVKGIVNKVAGGFVWLWNQITGGVTWLLSLPAKFWEAGRRLILSLWEGIKSVASAPYNAVKEIVGRIRDLLPFSPPKEGPLRDITTAGERIPEMLAKGITAGQDGVKSAVGDLLREVSIATADVIYRPAVMRFKELHAGEVMLIRTYREPFTVPRAFRGVGATGTWAEPGTMVTTPTPLGGDGANVGELTALEAPGAAGPTIENRNYYFTQHFERESVTIDTDQLDLESFKELISEKVKDLLVGEGS